MRSALSATLALCVASLASAGQWSAPLDFLKVLDPQGDRLSAAFDLGLARPLRRIDRVEIEFTMPDGFRGESVRSAYSTVNSNLAVVLTDSEGAGELAELFFASQVRLEGVPSRASWLLINAPAGERTTIVAPLLPSEVQPFPLPTLPAIELPLPGSTAAAVAGEPSATRDQSDVTFPVAWPESLLSGAGRVAFSERVETASTSPNWPFDQTLSIELGPPPAIESGTITVFGSLVPEPTAMGLALVAIAVVVRRR
ncbi:MAG: hypothetical protein AAF805_01460 [Planctomycetota bacterium]